MVSDLAVLAVIAFGAIFLFILILAAAKKGIEKAQYEMKEDIIDELYSNKENN